MKNIILSSAITALFISCGGVETTVNENVNSTKETFKVYGNCGMCEKTIEGSLKDVDGVVIGDWDKETKQIVVEFDANKIKLEDIKSQIAAVGYDMEDVKAEESVYNGLPGCCQYTRAGSESDMEMNDSTTHDHENHNH